MCAELLIWRKGEIALKVLSTSTKDMLRVISDPSLVGTDLGRLERAPELDHLLKGGAHRPRRICAWWM